MRKSRKIILSTLGVLIALLVTSLAVIRKDLEQVLLRTSEIQYEHFLLDEFSSVKASTNWNILIAQGRKNEIEIGKGVDQSKIQVVTRGDTLYLTADTTLDESIPIKLTAPYLKYIQATGNSKVKLLSFQSDSLQVDMKDSTLLTCYDNKMKQIYITTSGKAQIEFADTEWD